MRFSGWSVRQIALPAGKQWWAWLAGLGMAFLAACGGNAQPVIYTIAPSPTSTAALSPTAPAVLLVPTASPTPSRTPAPTTPTPGPSPTHPLAPTLSPLPATLTATSAPTLAGLSVEYFTTDSASVRPGDNVRLFWSTRGATRARIYRLDATGERIWRWDVNPSGDLTVTTRGSDRDVARFLLEIEGGGATAEQTLLIPLSCPETWFFDPAPETCPAGPPQVSLEAEQTFEHGRMIWVEALDRIYVVFEDGRVPTWAQYPDEFQEGDPDRDESLVPPPGLEQPIRGFGLVWRSNPRVRERLGWATSPEVAFDGMFQADSAESSVATLYLRTRDGAIIALDAFNEQWEVLPPAAGADTP